MKYTLNECQTPNRWPSFGLMERLFVWFWIVGVSWGGATSDVSGQVVFGTSSQPANSELSAGTPRRPFGTISPVGNDDLTVSANQNRPFGLGSAPQVRSPRLSFPNTENPVRLVGYADEYFATGQGDEYDHQNSWEQMSTSSDYGMPDRWITGVDGCRVDPNREPRWRDARPIPWESMAYGEYIGPPRTPHLPEYRVLIGDQIDFVFRRKRSLTSEAYRFGIGDILAVSSEQYEALNDAEQTIQLDGTIQVRGIGSVVAANKTVLELQNEINEKAQDIAGLKNNPEVLVKPINTETELQDLIKTVDATAGLGGLSRSVNVGPDGTVQLPKIGSIPALGLSLTELSAEANARYGIDVKGLDVTAILTARAPRFVYVMGEVRQPGQIALSGPTTVMQAIAQANGWGSGANLRHIVVMRRDKNWQLIATKVDLSGALWGHRPNPSDDLWLRHSDIILVPKNAGQRVADFVEVYLGRGLYGIFPTQGFSVRFDGVSRL
ncbi:MAG: polysaccharide biosynthesis/export family protein [Pirellulaceae bacterium]|nr:polysaccharide biosynthesis/export family protein [Pirellulaceae bacterium]